MQNPQGSGCVCLALVPRDWTLQHRSGLPFVSGGLQNSGWCSGICNGGLAQAFWPPAVTLKSSSGPHWVLTNGAHWDKRKLKSVSDTGSAGSFSTGGTFRHFDTVRATRSGESQRDDRRIRHQEAERKLVGALPAASLRARAFSVC